MVALAIGIAPNVPGFLHAAHVVQPSGPSVFDALYPYAWFIGFFLAGGVYATAMQLLPGLGKRPPAPAPSP